MPSARILAVDDEEFFLRYLGNHLEDMGIQTVPALNCDQALAALEENAVDLVITDLVMPGHPDGIELMSVVKKRCPDLPVILLTSQGDVESAVTAMKHGAFDFLQKPFNADTFSSAIQRALEFSRLSNENAKIKNHYREKFDFQSVVTCSPAMTPVLDLAAKVSTAPRTTVSLSGESGTGKEVLARAIHCASGCLPGTFVAVNCAAIPEHLLESELFGHVKGAFTGADRDREGKFTRAQGGTVLLDEIGDMPMSVQVKLLRVLEERVFEPVGGNVALPADFRVVTATHCDLSELVRQGKFRKDLYHRISVFPIVIPPLRDRKEDIPLLTDHFLRVMRNHLGKSLPGISKKALDLLLGYSWPGNVRELRNILEYAAILTANELVRPEHLRLPTAAPGLATLDSEEIEYCIRIPRNRISMAAITEAFTAQVLSQTLEVCGGNKTQAAAVLGMNRKIYYRQIGQAEV